MARTNRGARRTTFPPPLTKGAWVANRWGPRQTRTHNFVDGRDQTNYILEDGIVLPHHHATTEQPDTGGNAWQDQEHNTTVEVEPKTRYGIEGPAEVQQENATKMFSLPKDQLSQCHLYRLPTEILDQIFTLLVITGGVYQFTPVVEELKKNPTGSPPYRHVKPEEYCKETVTSIHFVHAPAERELERPPLQLALVSSRIRDIVCRIFYGQNQFVNEVAGRPLTSYVEVDDDLVLKTGHPTCATFRKTRMLFDTWCRLYSPTVKGLVGPLSINILRYVSNLTICIVPDTESSSSESKVIRQQLERIASAFSEDEERALKKLTVTFETLQPFKMSKTAAEAEVPGRYLTNHLRIKRAEGVHGLEMVADCMPSDDPHTFPHEVRIDTGVMRRDSVEFQDSVDNFQDVLAPLLRLEEVQLFGFDFYAGSESEGEYTTDGEESKNDGSDDGGSDEDESTDAESEDNGSNGDGPNGDESKGDKSNDAGSGSAKRQRVSY